ncbi:SAM-dependent methyltransferase [Myxococcota bacterium]
MANTPDWLAEKIRKYYQETEPLYLHWAGDSLGLHFGLADEHTQSRAESLSNGNAYLAQQLKIEPGTRVLDAGCGVGGSSIWLARERSAEVVGISIVAEQVELARRFAAEHGVSDRTSFLCMDFMATDFDEACFDVVWNLESLSHVLDVPAYLDHVGYLLRDGGRFGCLDLFVGAQGEPAHVRGMCEGWVLPNLGTLEELTETVRATGFVEVTTRDLTSQVLLSAASMRALATSRQFELRAQEVLLGVPQNPVHQRHLQGGLAAVAGLESGSIAYGFLGAVRPPR